MFKIGLIINPIAGLGGTAGFKGTDKPQIVEKALNLGVKPKSYERAKEAFKELSSLKSEIYVYTAGGPMGENLINELKFKGEKIYDPKNPKKTTKEDTKNCAKKLLNKKIDLLVFCGGDGTAVDIIEEVDMKIPILGIPAGVKMHSGVFATTPTTAAEIIKATIKNGLPLTEMEVMDIDEEAFRRGILSAELKGYAKVPYQPLYIQGAKMASPNVGDDKLDKKAIAKFVVEEMEENVYYILGPGTTVAEIGGLLYGEKTLLGVDVSINKKIIANDVNEKQILQLIDEKPSKIIVTPIGQQGFIFGRGNQQISPKVIRRVGLQNIIVVATPYKLSTLKGIRVDTGDPELDKKFSGYLKVITGYKEKQLVRILNE